MVWTKNINHIYRCPYTDMGVARVRIGARVPKPHQKLPLWVVLFGQLLSRKLHFQKNRGWSPPPYTGRLRWLVGEGRPPGAAISIAPTNASAGSGWRCKDEHFLGIWGRGGQILCKTSIFQRFYWSEGGAAIPHGISLASPTATPPRCNGGGPSRSSLRPRRVHD